jgi:hypothetical protein
MLVKPADGSTIHVCWLEAELAYWAETAKKQKTMKQA